ncbi:type III-B CRISPR-associated protein Cas10/Cmr2 [bacterium]|nr:type III-B CRISPR-associated protein Cas10/Cmr2 [bacterium]
MDNLKIEILKKLGFEEISEDTYWKYKIVSFLHDPPEKMLYINNLLKGSHEEASKEYLYVIDSSLIELIKNKKDIINLSDQIASGIDRCINLPDIRDFSLQRINPISGDRHDILTKSINKDNIKKVFKDINSKIGNQNDKFKKVFYYLYILLPEILKKEIEEMSPYDFIADTRIPDHSIFDHMIATSAISTSLPNVSFLLFSIGPVQPFIQTSRKTQDLFISSYLISYLSFKGILKVVELLGPDHIIYPDLRIVPLFKEWVRDKIFNNIDNTEIENYLRSGDEEKRIANIPNEFLCFIPDEYVKDIANAVENSIKNEWKNIRDKVKEDIKSKLIEDDEFKDKFQSVDNYYDEIWERQIETFPEIYWVSLPWVQQSLKNEEKVKNKENIEDYIKMIKSNFLKDFYFYDFYDTLKSREKKYEINNNIFVFDNYNSGHLYSLYHLLIDKLMSSRKLIKDFSTKPEPGYKCDMCGEREVMHINKNDSYSTINSFWGKLREKFSYNFKDNEKLCSVCTTKRLAQIIYFKDKIGKEQFPPTSEFANVKFKLDLYNKIITNENIEKFKEYFKKIPIKHHPLPKFINEFKDKLENFSSLDSLFFDEEFIKSEKIIKEYPEIKNTELSEIRREFKELKNFLPSLGKYFSIIYMDGDNIGDWIAGLKTPDLINTFNTNYIEKWKKDNPDLFESFIEKINWISYVYRGDGKAPKTISAAIHREISRRLSEFSIQETRKIIEEENYGKIIYSGGDDIMAFVALNSLLDVIKKLRDTFSLEKYMGKRATASMGVVIGHYEEPLSFLLEELRKALKDTKNVGRDRYTIKIIKKSGTIKEFNLPWYIDGISSVDLLKEITFLFSEKILSFNFPYDLDERDFVDFPDEILKNHFQKIWKRNVIVEAKDRNGNLYDRIYKFLEENIRKNRKEGLTDIIEIFMLGKFFAQGEVVE